jgi:predicted SAM-dependent methyltransferase
MEKGGNMKLNIGCGVQKIDGWVNIDIVGNNIDLKHDVRKPLPYSKDTVSYAYSEHMIEHLTPDEGRITIQNVMNPMKPGGVFRIATFDLDTIVTGYIDGSWKDWGWAKSQPHLHTKVDMINIAFYWWEHKWLYTADELLKRANEAGYSNCSVCTRGISSHKDLCNRETRENSTLIVEITK